MSAAPEVSLDWGHSVHQRAGKACSQTQGHGIFLRPVNLDKAVLLCYHDAGWANAPQNPDDPYYMLDDADEERGRIKDGPFACKERKAKSSLAPCISSPMRTSSMEVNEASA